MRILEDVGLTFDDVMLVPRMSTILSRFGGEIDLSTEILPGINLKIPIITANMDTITDSQMATAMLDLGGLGIPHRKADLSSLSSPRIACIGLGLAELTRLADFTQESLAGVLIDVAHGHSSGVVQQIKNIKKLNPNLPVIAGNVATKEAVIELSLAGADCVKIGVGPGSLCTTRIQTGCGVPQFSAIVECVKAARSRGLTTIADGGIRNSGDITKALAAGADAVMIGSLVAGTEETPGQKMKRKDGTIVKKYRGMASKEFQEENKGTATSIEGETRTVPYKGPVDSVIKYLVNGILSGMSYQDARSLRELTENAVFVRQTNAGFREALPHGLL